MGKVEEMEGVKKMEVGEMEEMEKMKIGGNGGHI